MEEGRTWIWQSIQVLKPGGKAVCKHKKWKVGFNVAQAELE
jgi:hypothetical protein